MTIARIPYFTIKSTATKVPAMGFGSGTAWRLQKWKQHDENRVYELVQVLVDKVETAIDVGFRHIDTSRGLFHTPPSW
jgi:diketogulonate reductase-like aldo/keto reductase